MADEAPFDSERPPDEAWWTGELHRNEKLMDQFMAVLGDAPDWDKVNAADLPARPDHAAPAEPVDDDDPFTWNEAVEDTALVETPDEAEADADEDPELNADYDNVSQLARDFACAVFDLENPPNNAELLFLSAGKVGANLAGGHGLGYDEDFLCGNIVKCRWALSDCEFCRAMLEPLHQQTGEAQYAALIRDSLRIAELLRERIARLRQRVWW